MCEEASGIDGVAQIGFSEVLFLYALTRRTVATRLAVSIGRQETAGRRSASPWLFAAILFTLLMLLTNRGLNRTGGV